MYVLIHSRSVENIVKCLMSEIKKKKSSCYFYKEALIKEQRT